MSDTGVKETITITVTGYVTHPIELWQNVRFALAQDDDTKEYELDTVENNVTNV